RHLPREPAGPGRPCPSPGRRHHRPRFRRALDHRGHHPPARLEEPDVIELDLELPLSTFALRVSARLEEGVAAVMGPSGSGTTARLESICGLRAGARGRIVVAGETLLDSATGLSKPPEQRRVGYVPQDPGLFPHLKARANVRFGARGDDRSIEAAVSTLEI